MMVMIPNVDEETWHPSPEKMAEMGRYNEELGQAGVLLALDGLQPTSKGARVSFAGGKPTVIDGPFTEAKELIGGYWLIQTKSKEEAVQWAVAVSMAQGPESGLELIDALGDEPSLRDYHLLPSVRADLLARLGRTHEARAELARAATMTQNEQERALLLERAERLA